MSQTITVRNVSRRPQDIEGGQVLAHNEEGEAPDSPHTRALLDERALIRVDQPAPALERPSTRPRGGTA